MVCPHPAAMRCQGCGGSFQPVGGASTVVALTLVAVTSKARSTISVPMESTGTVHSKIGPGTLMQHVHMPALSQGAGDSSCACCSLQHEAVSMQQEGICASSMQTCARAALSLQQPPPVKPLTTQQHNGMANAKSMAVSRCAKPRLRKVMSTSEYNPLGKVTRQPLGTGVESDLGDW